jgi:sulfatase maturation enzyme AslB (radical SAM superfamily)
LPSRCQICNFLPACPKPCSQKLLEKGENLPCILNKKYGKENYIIEDFYNFLIERNNEK